KGTSAPEFSVGVASAIHNATGVAIGNVLGSNIANILLILGTLSVICPLSVRKNTLYYEMPFIIFITVLLMWFGWSFGGVTRGAAGLFCILFAIYMLYMFYVPSGSDTCENTQIKEMSGLKITLNILLGLGALILGSDLTVSSAVDIARYLNVSERIIGLTIIAVGTSLPELTISITAALKHRVDLAIGNIIGSNIFNIVFILGIIGLINPLPFEPAFIFDSVIALLAAVLLWMCTLRKSKLTRIHGILFLLLYLIYLLYLIFA
ncbi:MAG: calcium/sodium antiporter, partial [Alphaproteobacteria bacterium]|nr:calcium/sodium antiporter [Alphaproteobacteria bacterium]